MTEPVSEQIAKFTQADAGLGNFDLDVRPPIVLVGVCRAIRRRGCLHSLQLVQKSSRDNLAGEAVPDHVGRNRESFHHKTMIRYRIADHDQATDANDGYDQDHKQAQRHA